MTLATHRGLTLVELLASLALLSLVCGACMAWVTTVSRGSMSTLDGRLNAGDADRAAQLLRELELRSTDERRARIDPQGRLVLPTRWWVVAVSGDIQLAQWALVELDKVTQAAQVTFVDDGSEPLGQPRVLIEGVTSLEVDDSIAPDGESVIRVSMTSADGIERQMVFAAEARP